MVQSGFDPTTSCSVGNVLLIERIKGLLVLANNLCLLRNCIYCYVLFLSAQQKGTAPQATRLQVSQSPVRSVSPGQQITIRNVTQTLPVTQTVKTAATTSDRSVQGMFHAVSTNRDFKIQ